MQKFSLPLQTLGLLQERLSSRQEIQGLSLLNLKTRLFLWNGAFFVFYNH